MEPNQAQQAPVTNDEKIAQFAQGYLEDVERDDDPDRIEVDTEAEQSEQPEQEASPEEEQAEEPKAEEAETPPQEPEEPVVEFELEDGKKLKVPEALKPHLMRDKDYRQKTMALAEQRKALEQLTTQAQQVATQSQQMAPYYAQLYAMENRANQLGQLLTNELMTNDPLEFNKAQGELAILLRNRDQLAAGLQYQQNALNEQQNKLLKERLALDAPKLFEEVPDLAKPGAGSELAKYLASQGLTEAEMFQVDYSTRLAKLGWKAKQYDQMVKDNAKNAEKLKQQVKSLPPVSLTSRASADADAQSKKLHKDWKKSGGKVSSPVFDQLLRERLRGK